MKPWFGAVCVLALGLNWGCDSGTKSTQASTNHIDHGSPAQPNSPSANPNVTPQQPTATRQPNGSGSSGAENPPYVVHEESVEVPILGGEDAEARLWKGKPSASASKTGILFVSGVDGGFIEPADDIYDRLAEKYAPRGVSSIFVKYRSPGELEPSVMDALGAAQYLRNLGIQRMAVIGWSFGGAVITNVTPQIPEAVTVVGFAPQAKDTEAIAGFTHQSILLFHSHDDENVPFESSQIILDEAPPGLRSEFRPLDGFDHHLDGSREVIEPIVDQWLERELSIPE